jgi:2-C-methyl-D-erythritol 4-phosphate cytidylyltransferase
LAGVSLLSRAISAVTQHPSVIEVVVAGPAHDPEVLRPALPPSRAVVRLVPGGATRQQSVAAALAAADPAGEIVLVHDAARPLVPPRLLARVVDAVVCGAPAVVPGLPVVDTIKEVDQDRVVVRTPPRERLVAVQTPQGFARAALELAHRTASADHPGATDDAALAEAAGIPVLVVPGEPAAMKVTYPEDFARAEQHLAAAR